MTTNDRVQWAWLRAVPDEPRWVEIRAMLLHPGSNVLGEPQGGLVVDVDRSVAGVVGQPAEPLLAQAFAILSADAELLVPAESIGHVAALVPEGTARRAVVHTLGSQLPAPDDADVDLSVVDAPFLSSLPEELAEEARGAKWAAARRVDGSAVSICTAWWITERHWDVGVDTLPEHQRQGHARSCFLTLADHLAGHSLQPVWGAFEDNVASLGMAAGLGFVPDGEIWVVDDLRRSA